MPLSLKEYHGLKSNTRLIMLFSVHYIHTAPVFRGWGHEFCCDFTNTLSNGVHDSLAEENHPGSKLY